MEHHESKFDAETLLAHIDWVQGLARSLVRDPNLADDVSQETWLAALRHAPPKAGSMRAWLGSVTRNIVRQENRREAIRRDHEARASDADGLPSTGELVARVAVQRVVVEAVLALDDPYRRTILLRYFEGLAPKAIASRIGIPVATVKTRLGRGLEILRRRLDRQHGDDGSTWLHALAPLVPRTGWKGAVSGGAWIVTTKMIVGVAAGALALVLAGLWIANTETARVGKSPLADGERELLVAEPTLLESGALGLSSDGERVAVTETSDVPEGSLRIVVVDAKTGKRVPGAVVHYGPASIWSVFGQSRAQGENPDREALLLESGLHATADEQGVAIAPGSRGSGSSVGNLAERGWSPMERHYERRWTHHSLAPR